MSFDWSGWDNSLVFWDLGTEMLDDGSVYVGVRQLVWLG